MQYTVIREIGRGAKGVVYLVEKDGMRFALKTLLREDSPAHLDSVLRFRQEMMALSSLQHPSIVRVFEAGEHDGEPFTVMEFLDGPNLYAQIREGAIPRNRALDIALQLASALQEIHRHKFVHRDVKPENIVITGEGTVKLVDFGMVARIGKEAAAMGTEPVVGTVLYSAPEQCGLIPGAVNETADLYSLGAVMHEMLTGKNLFEGIDPGVLIQKKTKDIYQEVMEAHSNSSFVLGQIVAKLVDPDPAQRYQSARGLIADLKNLASLEECRKNGTPYALGTADRSLQLREGRLIGRRSEVEFLQSVWQKTHSHSGGAIVIEGEGGVGKTRLVQELMDQARAGQGEVLSVRCSQIGAMALAPVLDALKHYFNNLLLLPREARRSTLDNLKTLPAAALRTLADASEEIAALLEMDSGHSTSGPVSQEASTQHLIQIFRWISERKGGLLIVLEDIQWIDEASRDFLKRFAREIDQQAIMIAVTSREPARLGETWRTLKLTPLSPAESQDLISSWLGDLAIDPKIAEKITVPTNFNAFSMREYLSGMIEAGVLTVERGQVLLDFARLASIGLSVDASSLIKERVKRLPSADREVLRHAAVVGLRFSLPELSAFLGKSPLDVNADLQNALRANLLEAVTTDEFGFTHQSTREACLSLFSESELREAHDRAAVYLQGMARKSPAQIYALARHYQYGNPPRDANAAITALTEAGQLAMDNYSNQIAYTILKFAQGVLVRQAVDPARAFHCKEVFGAACFHTSRFDEGNVIFDELLSQVRDPLIKGRILYWKVKIQHGSGRMEAAWQTLVTTLVVLGKPYRENLFSKITGLLYYSSLYYWRLYSGREIESVANAPLQDPQRRERMSLLAKLLEIGIDNCFYRTKILDMIHLVFRANAYAHQLGATSQSVRAISQAAAVNASVHLQGLSEKGFRLAYAAAKTLGDESVWAFVDFHYVLTRQFLSRVDEYDEFFAAYLPRAEKLLTYWEFGAVIVAHTSYLAQRGLFQELANFYFHRMSWLDETQNLGLMADFRETYAARLVFLGRPEEAAKIRTEAERYYVQVQDNNTLSRAIKVGMRLFLAAEGMQLEAPTTDEDVESFLAARPSAFFIIYVILWCVQIRLLQYEFAKTDEQRRIRLAQFHSALKFLRKRASTDLLKCMTEIMRAAAARIAKDFAKAEALIEAGERLGEKCRSENASYFALVERARLARDKGSLSRQKIEVLAAYRFAQERGWKVRLDQLEREFGVLAKQEVRPAAQAATLPGGLDRQRAMNALLKISAAASRSIDPMEQSRATLDTAVQLLGAERACIFLGASNAALKFFLGRTALAEDIAEMKGFSTTVVKRVFDERKPMIITGTEQGEAIGSKSIVAHNLKSIMVVPLVLAQDIKGVIYLDSSISKSLFSEADLDLLVSISTQIASSIHFSELAAAENDRQMMKKDLELSVSVQNLFLPAVTDADYRGLSLTAFYRPAAQCGGDWWWNKTQGSNLYLMVGDVGGHGVGPAMITASVASVYKIWEKSATTDIRELILSTNRHLFEIAQGEHYMTLFGCEINPQTKTVRYWSAGAPPFLVQNRFVSGSAFVGEAGGLVGADAEGLRLGAGEYQAKSGDRLFIYSDGISEMVDERGRVLGYRRMAAILEKLKDKDVHELKAALVERLDQLRGSASQEDDFTFVIIDIA